MKPINEAQIRDLFLGFAKDHKQYLHSNYSEGAIWYQLSSHLENSLANPTSSLSSLDSAEQQKARQLLGIFWLAHYPESRPFEDISSNESSVNVIVQHYTHEPAPYCRHNDFLYNYLLLSTVLNPPVYAIQSPFWWGLPDFSTESHHHRHNQKKEGDAAAVLAILAVIAIASIGLILSAFALYYLIQHMAHDMERFYYNEGMWRALTHMSVILASATAGMIFASLVLSSPLIALGMSAGISAPILLAVFGVMASGLVTASLGCFIGNKLLERFCNNNHTDKIDPLEPERFSISKSQEARLSDNNLAPLAARAALVAIRAEIAALENQHNPCANTQKNRPLPFYLSRFFGAPYQKEIQKLLHQARQIQAGALDKIKVGELTFNLLQSAQPYAVQSVQDLEPSAPPLREELYRI